MLPCCDECGCPSVNLQVRQYQHALMRLCLVCVVMFDAVCTRHMMRAQVEYLAENARRIQAKRVLLDG